MSSSLHAWAVFLAGLISFFSPCVLPLVPPYLCFLAGTSLEELSQNPHPHLQRKILACAFFFVLGFSTIFIGLGATATWIGSLLRDYFHILSVLSGLLIIFMGLHFLGVLRIFLLYREFRPTLSAPPGRLSAYLLGMAFAFGWTPCIGPILATILSLAGAEETLLQGSLLLALYSAGLGLPFLGVAASLGFFGGRFHHIRPWFLVIEKIMGIGLILTGLAFLTGAMPYLSFWLLSTFPALGEMG